MKKLSYLFLAFALVMTLTACGSQEAKDTEKVVEEDVTAAKNYFKEESEKAVEDVKNLTEVGEEDVKKAVDYLNEHVVKKAEDISEDTWKQITYYSTWLAEVAKKDATIAEHDVVTLATHAKNWASVAWAKTTDGISETEEELKEKLTSVAETVKKDVDNLIKDFTSKFK